MRKYNLLKGCFQSKRITASISWGLSSCRWLTVWKQVVWKLNTEWIQVQSFIKGRLAVGSWPPGGKCHRTTWYKWSWVFTPFECLYLGKSRLSHLFQCLNLLCSVYTDIYTHIHFIVKNSLGLLNAICAGVWYGSLRLASLFDLESLFLQSHWDRLEDISLFF